MKRNLILLIGILVLCAGCQDEFAEPDLDATFAKKSAKYEKVKTHHIKGWVQTIGDDDAPRFPCTPIEYGVDVCSKGWLIGHLNILGKMVQEESTYEKLNCELMLTPEGPVAYNEVKAVLTFEGGESAFVFTHAWLNVATGELWGHTDFDGGTGRFEGITGTLTILNGIQNSDGHLSWDTEGDLTLVIK